MTKTDIIIIGIVILISVVGFFLMKSHSDKLYYELKNNPLFAEATIIRLNTDSSIPIVLGRTTMAGSHPSLRYEYKVHDSVLYGGHQFYGKSKEDEKLLSQLQLGDKFIIIYSDSLNSSRIVFDCPITDSTPFEWYLEEFKTNPIKWEDGKGFVFKKRE